MASKTRIEKLEKAAGVKINTWNPAIIEVVGGHEKDPNHIQRLNDIEAEAGPAGWTPDGGPCLVEVILNDEQKINRVG